ncbi:MAG: hypothetical protein ACFFDI_29095, partial [Promethearchaeota archaeon]
DIHLAVKFLTNYLTYFKKPNGKNFMQHQFLDFFSKGYHLGWVEPYYNRFDKTDEFYRKVQWHKATYDKYGCGFTSLYFRKFSP